jgi:hypothetical protein
MPSGIFKLCMDGDADNLPCARWKYYAKNCQKFFSFCSRVKHIRPPSFGSFADVLKGMSTHPEEQGVEPKRL